MEEFFSDICVLVTGHRTTFVPVKKRSAHYYRSGWGKGMWCSSSWIGRRSELSHSGCQRTDRSVCQSWSSSGPWDRAASNVFIAGVSIRADWVYRDFMVCGAWPVGGYRSGALSGKP